MENNGIHLLIFCLELLESAKKPAEESEPGIPYK
jgi:hypothetical protein